MSSSAVRTTPAVLCWSVGQPWWQSCWKSPFLIQNASVWLKKLSFCSALLFSVIQYSHFWDFYLSTVVVNISFLLLKAVGFEVITGLPELGSVVKNTKDLLCCCCYWVNWSLNVRTEVGCNLHFTSFLSMTNFRRATRETWDSWVNFFLPLFLVAYKWTARVLPAFTINHPPRKENSLRFTL